MPPKGRMRGRSPIHRASLNTKVGRSRGLGGSLKRSAFRALPPKALALAASLHDEGKKAERWQPRFQGVTRRRTIRARWPTREDARADQSGGPRWLSARVRIAASRGRKRRIQGRCRRTGAISFCISSPRITAVRGPSSRRKAARMRPPSALQARAPRCRAALRAAAETLGAMGACMVGGAPARRRPAGFARQ